MDEDQVEQYAQFIANDMIVLARSSGDDPVVFVTNNNNFPALRAFGVAERVWQFDQDQLLAGDGMPDQGMRPPVTNRWAQLIEQLDETLECAQVYRDIGPDGSIYVVDLMRFSMTDLDDTAETLQAQWTKISAVAHFKPRRAQQHLVTVHLAEKDGETVTQVITS